MKPEELKQKRQKMMELFFKAIAPIDKSGKNKELYENKFGTMSDKQFETFFNNFFKGKDNFILQFIPFENEPTMEDAMKSAKILNFSFNERVFLNHFKEGYMSDFECMILPLGIKRLQQMINKKNSTSFTATNRDSKTGQVINEDKNARVSDTETAAMMVTGMEDVLKEFLGPRADDIVGYNEMTKQILEKGFVSQEDIPNDPRNKTTLNLIDVYFLGAGIKSNLITEDLVLLSTLDKETGAK